MTRTEPRRRRGPATSVAPFLVIGIVGLLAWAVVTAFNTGVGAGLTTATTIVLVYQVPAVIFDWPRMTVEHIVEFLGWLWGIVCSPFD